MRRGRIEYSKMSKMKFDNAIMAAYAVRGMNGKIDVEATKRKFAEQLEQFVTHQEINLCAIGLNVDKVFDKNPNVYLSKSWVIKETLDLIAPRYNDFLDIRNSIEDYLRDNSSYDYDSPRIFYMKRGVGMCRRRDMFNMVKEGLEIEDGS